MLSQQGHAAEAATYYDAALKVDPGDPVALNYFSRLLASSPDPTVRNSAKAADLARRLNQRMQNPGAVAALAMAYAAYGKYADAIDSISQAQTLATSQGNTKLADALQGQRKLFEVSLKRTSP